MPYLQLARSHGKVTEAMDLLRVRTAAEIVHLERIQIGAAAAVEDVRRRVIFKVQDLKVVIVPRHVQVDMVLAEQGIPIASQHGVIAMGSVGVHRMVPHHDQKGRCPRPLQLRLNPLQLFPLLLRRQREVGPVRWTPVPRAHVAFEHNAMYERRMRREIEGVPARGQSPARRLAVRAAADARVLEFGFDLVHRRRQPLVIMIAQHGIRGPGKYLRGIHLLKLRQPPS